MSIAKKTASCLAVIAIACAIGCSGDDSDDNHGHDGNELAAECKAIMDACHDKDPGTPGKVNDCHTTAHGAVAESCAAVQAECIAVCNAAPIPE